MQAQTFQGLRGRLMRDALLAEYTSWRVGGPADLLFIPADIDDAAHFLRQLPASMPVLWLGLGSNVLVRDGGVEGAVIITQGALDTIAPIDTLVIRAEAGVSCAQFARHTARLGLSGVEFLAGIPGTIGGALAMNAGCYGGETWQKVQQVETLHRSGQKQVRPFSDFEVSYRHVAGLRDEWFVAGYFELTRGEKKQSLDDIRVLIEKRNAAQPTGLPNCGSVFRNPTGDHAARLIEQCNLKGKIQGGASVSTKHANFIINENKATAADIEILIADVAEIVLQKQGVRLIPEVCIIGRAASR